MRVRRDDSHDASLELATLLARAFLRLMETSRRVAVSFVDAEQIPLDVSRPSRPDVDGNEAA